MDEGGRATQDAKPKYPLSGFLTPFAKKTKKSRPLSTALDAL